MKKYKEENTMNEKSKEANRKSKITTEKWGRKPIDCETCVKNCWGQCEPDFKTCCEDLRTF